MSKWRLMILIPILECLVSFIFHTKLFQKLNGKEPFWFYFVFLDAFGRKNLTLLWDFGNFLRMLSVGVIVVSQWGQTADSHTVNPSLHPARFTAWPGLAQPSLADELPSCRPARPVMESQISEQLLYISLNYSLLWKFDFHHFYSLNWRYGAL